MGDALADVSDTLGAALIGTFLSAILSGTLFLQVTIYFRVYTVDFSRNRLMVGTLWVLDIVHVSMAFAALWTYLITNKSNDAIADFIPWTVAVTVALTAIITFIVHCFFAHRIYILGGQRIWLTTPIVLLAFGRLFAAIVSTSEMIRLKHYSAFVSRFGWVFTTGLSSAALVDILITVSLVVILQKSRTGYSTSTDHIIDSIVLYTIETGLITCVTTIISLICWITMPNNLIFLALHFTISKLYANSVLAILNARRSLRKRIHRSTDYLPSLPGIPLEVSGQRSFLPGGPEQQYREYQQLARLGKRNQNRPFSDPGPWTGRGHLRTPELLWLKSSANFLGSTETSTQRSLV